MFWLKSFLWFILCFFLKHYYHIKIAKTKEEKEKIFKFRYNIYRREMEHYFLDEKKIAVNDMLYDDDDFQDNTVILYSGDIDDITGTLRLTTWSKDVIPQRIRSKYFISDEILKNVDRIGEFRFFQIERHYRRSPLAYVLLSYMYKITSEPNNFTDIIFSDCQPGLLIYYFKMGAFIYTRKVISEEFGILQVPIAIAPFDINYFKKNRYSLYFTSKYYLNQYRKKVASAVDKDFAPKIPHLSLFIKPEELVNYCNNIAPESLRDHCDFLIGLFNKIIALSLEKGTIVIKKDIIDYDAYLLIDGPLGVYIDDVLIAELKPGSIFGEMALLNEKHKRYTDVIADSNAKIIIIPRNLLSRLERKDPKSAIKLLHFLSNSISEKLASANEVLHEFSKTKTNK